MINKLTVIGSGLMGHGIALKFAQHGCIATVFDPNQSSMDTLFKRIEISLIQMDVSKLNIKKCLSLIRKSNNLKQSLENCELVIEAAPEKLKLNTNELLTCESQKHLNDDLTPI